MSKKYEHRVDSLKEHKKDKGRKGKRIDKAPNPRNKKVSKQKKALKDFHKKMEKSKKIW